MLTRDLGQRRIGAATIGLTAASVVGTLAVGVAAYAKESAAASTSTPGPVGTPAPADTSSPAADQPAPATTGTTPQLPGPGKITGGGGSGHATSGGS